jgi:Tol biopolymer transport system component
MRNILFFLALAPTAGLYSQSISPAGVIARVIDSDARMQALAPGMVSLPKSSEWASSFTPDGKTVYFARATEGPPGYALYAKRENGQWQQPIVASFSGGRYSDMDPFVSPDGKKVVFISNRPAENNPADSAKRSLHIWYATYKGNDTWSTPHELDSAVNLAGIGNFGPSMSAKGTLYYCTHRKELQGMQSFYNQWLGDHYGPAKQVIIPGAREIQDPYIAPDESYLIYKNGRQLDISFRQGKDWSAPQNLGPQVNSMEAGDPYVSPDGKTFYLSADNGDIMMIPIHLDRAHIKASLDAAASATAAAAVTSTAGSTSASAAAAAAAAAKPELFAPGIISGPVDDASPTFTPDGKTVYFHRRGAAFGGVILTSTLKDGKWSEPQIASFSGKWSDIEPAMSPDGSYLVFSSNRPTAPGGEPLNGRWGGQTHVQRGGNLWRVNWWGTGWGEPYRLPDIVNSDTTTFAPAVTADGSLYFMRPLNDTGKFHIYYAALHSGRFDKPVLVSWSAADNRSDFDPVVAPDESFAVFCSNRATLTTGQLFIVYRKAGKWGEPVSLGDGINWPAESNQEARLSPDLRTLYFSNGYAPPVTFPSDSATVQQRMAQSQWFTGANNIWSVSLDPWLPVTH